MKKYLIYRNPVRFLTIYAIILFVSLLTIYLLFSSSKQTIEMDFEEQAITDITTFSNVFLDEISQLSTDIFLITDLLNVHDSLVINDGSTEFNSQSSRTIIETEFMVWLGMKQAYDQIRIIDNNGQEVIRANYNSGSPYIVVESELQNKANRYYFAESIVLDNRDLYMSVLDLNVENGEIEVVDGKVKPMIRVATPLFNKDGEKLGIVIINYLADDLFQALRSSNISSGGNIEIINENGYYLYAEDKSIEFGFMYDELQDEVFSKYHDYDIFSIPNGEITIATYDDEFYTSLKISSSELTEAANETIGDQINIQFGTKEFIIFKELDLIDNPIYKNSVKLYTTISIVVLVIALLISRLIDESIHLRDEYIKRIKFDSLHDILTTLPNRKNIYEKIQYLIQRNKVFTILFIDFDGFKDINDQFGHEIGDDALIQGSDRIKNNIRFNDTLGRIGGDEFIVILEEISSEEVVSRICRDLISSFNEPFDLSGKTAQLGLSIGAFICDNSDYTIDKIISNSDQAMYEVKNSGKNNFLIFNQLNK